VRAVTLPSYGGPEVLTLADVPDPVVGSGEVLVDVVATAVNRADALQRMGFYHPPPGASPYPGLECSGRISALATDVAGWQVGDEVCALLSGGGYAEKVAVPAGQLLPLPAGVSLVDAAGLPEVVCTVWSNIFQLAALQPGEVLLVHGGTSGIGTMAIQLAARHGARVLCTVGTTAKAVRAEALGAQRAIRYRDEDFVEVVRSATGGTGADVIVDNMGAAYLARNVEALAVRAASWTSARCSASGPPSTRRRYARARRRTRRRWSRQCSPVSGRRSRPVRCGRSSTGCCHWSRSSRRTEHWTRAATSARSC